MGGCAADGGCPTDYVALAVSAFAFFLLLARATFPFLVYKVSRPKGGAFWIPTVQVLASFDLLLAIVVITCLSKMMSSNLIKIQKRDWWQSCYIWSVWVEGPLGFGLLLCCRIVQAFQLYSLFVNKRLPPIKSYISLPLVLFPWTVWASVVHFRKPLNYRCQMSAWWIIPSVSLHLLYVLILMGFIRAIQHVEFRFHEIKDLRRGVFFSGVSLGIWVAAYVLIKVHEHVEWIQVFSRFLLLIVTSVFVLAFFSTSISQPLLSQISLRNKKCHEYENMGRALGIYDSGMLSQKKQTMAVDISQPLDQLFLIKKFRQSFMAFADSRLAGESVHFYDEVLELGKLAVDDTVRRIYMARHIIEKYIIAGAPMEVNISHRTRQEILTTPNLTHPALFKTAVDELLQLMKMNLERDYWSSMFYSKFKEEANANPSSPERELVTSWNVSPRLSSVRAVDDPFHQETKGVDHGSP